MISLRLLQSISRGATPWPQSGSVPAGFGFVLFPSLISVRAVALISISSGEQKSHVPGDVHPRLDITIWV